MSDAINPDHYKRLPAEAIEIIEAAIDKAPSNQDAYLHGQALKYLLRCWNKNGIEDLKKAKWYLDRLIDLFDESEQRKEANIKSLMDYPFGEPEQAIKQSSTTEPPDGWRWLGVGAVIRKGDRYWLDGDWWDYYNSIEAKVLDTRPSIRRNRFDIGEKVVRVSNGVVYKVIRILSMGYQLESEFCAEVILNGKDLVPYIEETT